MFEGVVFAAVVASGPSNMPDSTYQGQHHSRKWEPWRRCVMWRESRGDYRARNPSSSAAGAYQFLDRAWRRSLVFMLIREHRREAGEVRSLRAVPIHRWPRYWQDAAFWTVLNDGAGAKHWALRGSACNRVKP